MSRSPRLVQLSSQLDSIIRLAYNDEDEKRPNKTVGSAVRAGALVGGAGAGLYGIGAMSEGLTGRQSIAKGGYDLSRVGKGGAENIASTIGKGYGVAKTAAKPYIAKGASAISSLFGKLRGLAKLSARMDQVIEFGSVASLKKVGSHIKRHAGVYAAGAAGAGFTGAVAGVTASAVNHIKKQNKWRKKAGDDEFLPIAKDLYIDKHGAMYPGKHPRVQGGTIAELNAKLDSLIEFGRGDIILKGLKKWGAAQKPDLRELTKESINFPGVKELMKKDMPGYAKVLGSKKDAKYLMPILRQASAKSAWADRKSGILKRKGMSINDLIAARGLGGVLKP